MNDSWRKLRATALMLALLPSGVVIGDDSAQQSTADAAAATVFARVATDDLDQPTALQLAIVTYSRDNDSKLRVDLVSAIHIGDRAYYAELNDRFKGYDALLYELVAPKDTVVTHSDTRPKSFISNAQLAMTQLLNLSFQLDEIDYKQPNFIHADLSSTELAQSMDERGESLYVYFWRVFFASINEYAKDPLGLRDWQMLSAVLSSEQDNTLKTMFAYEMTDMDRLRDILGEDAGSAVIGARNQRAVDVLCDQIESGVKRVGIFYGVAHMSDLEQRLRTQLALTPHSVVWVDAWKLAPESTIYAE